MCQRFISNTFHFFISFDFVNLAEKTVLVLNIFTYYWLLRVHVKEMISPQVAPFDLHKMTIKATRLC